MQRIDIMFSSVINEISRKIVPIELKSTIAYPEITIQLQRYIDWLEQYYSPNNKPSIIEPIIIARKSCQNKEVIKSFEEFNKKNNLKIKYMQFEIKDNKIEFEEVQY